MRLIRLYRLYRSWGRSRLASLKQAWDRTYA